MTDCYIHIIERVETFIDSPRVYLISLAESVKMAEITPVDCYQHIIRFVPPPNWPSCCVFLDASNLISANRPRQVPTIGIAQ